MRNPLCYSGLSRGRCCGLSELVDSILLLVAGSENLFLPIVVRGLAECGIEREKEGESRAHESMTFHPKGTTVDSRMRFSRELSYPR